MSKMEPIEINKCLRNTLREYKKSRKGGGIQNRWRLLGAMEAFLMTLGVIQPGKIFDYKEIEEVVWSLFFVIRRKRKEYYREHIVRITEDWLGWSGDR